MSDKEHTETPNEHVIGTVESANGDTVIIRTDTGEQIRATLQSQFVEASPFFAPGNRWNFGLRRSDGDSTYTMQTIADAPPQPSGEGERSGQ